MSPIFAPSARRIVAKTLGRLIHPAPSKPKKRDWSVYYPARNARRRRRYLIAKARGLTWRGNPRRKRLLNCPKGLSANHAAYQKWWRNQK